MNKEIQDKAWAVLPKEFKEKVKLEFNNAELSARLPHDAFLRGEHCMLGALFGNHNLTSDTETEEELTASRKAAEESYNKSFENHIAGSENNQPTTVNINRPNINLSSPSDNQIRIMVAAEAMKGILCNPNVIMSCGCLEGNQEYVTKHAVMYADAMLAECGITGKGGTSGRNDN